ATGVIPRSNFASDFAWLEANGLTAGATTAVTGVIPRSNFASDMAWLEANGLTAGTATGTVLTTTGRSHHTYE
ncbi:MAG: hypothetical protein OEU32_04940, partial [Acidimicrobiia bacterium]|nr:hypothetical protein [Acidimicrobiia bacterium]